MSRADPLRLGLWLLGLAIVLVLMVTLARAGSSSPAQHEVVLVASAQDWSASPYPATVFACTRSSGAPPCAVGVNTAQVIADLLDAGYHADPQLGQATLGYGLALVK